MRALTLASELEIPASGFRVVHGDSREILSFLADDYADHIVTDPPYNERTHANASTMWGFRKKGGPNKIDIDFDPLAGFEFVPDLLRVGRRWVLAFCALEDLGRYSDAAGALFVRSGIWDRPDGTPQLTGDRPGQGAEGIAVMHGARAPGEGRMAWGSGGKRGIWRHGVERNERHHPTVKPLPLMLELIQDFTNEGDLVLDPYCGSGTTGVACLRLGRRFLGIELDENHARTAQERLEAEMHGLNLSDARNGQRGLFEGAL